jgi:hypothetical protein
LAARVKEIQETFRAYSARPASSSFAKNKITRHLMDATSELAPTVQTSK